VGEENQGLLLERILTIEKTSINGIERIEKNPHRLRILQLKREKKKANGMDGDDMKEER
jgi:hypothetical protein